MGLATNKFLLLEKYLHELETISAQHLGFNKIFIISLVSKYFGSLRLGYSIETNRIKFQTIDPEIHTLNS